MSKFLDVFEDITKKGTKIPTEKYLKSGKYPIIDQGQTYISGYCNDETGLFYDVPAIIFGDHTRIIKYVDSPCFLGADGVKLLKAKDNTANYKYLYYVLCNAEIPNTGYNRHFKWLKEIEIPLPSPEKQCEIAETLDKVTNLIDLCNQMLDKLDLLVKSRFVEMFGDPVDNPMNWEIKTLLGICTKLTDGTHFSPESFTSGDYKYITAKNIKYDGFDFSNLTYVNADVHKEIYARCNPEYGDVLYIKDGVTTGIAMINTLNEPFTLLSSVALLKYDRSIINNYFLVSALNNKHMYDFVRSNMGGAAITRLTITKLNEIKIPVPPIELQNQFSEFVQSVDKSKVKIKQLLEKAETLKKSLMQEYFSPQ